MFPIYNLKVVDKPGLAFGSIEYVPTEPILDTQFSDNLNYDEEVNRFLDQVEEEFLRDKPENYDFPEDTHHVGSIPDWYRDMLTKKIQEAKSRLEKLSDLVCATSPSTAVHIKRIEEDHSTAFCKMDYPRHPPMHKSWRSTWEFRYARKCKETDSSNHIHLADCNSLVVEDFKTGVCVHSPNVSQHDYPQHVICVARLFRNFARKINKKINISKLKEKPECEDKPASKNKSKSKGMQNVDTMEDDWWTTMTMVLISNHLNELMIVVRRENVNKLVPDLKSYFQCVIVEHPNIVSVLAFHARMTHMASKQWLAKVFKKNQHRKELLIAGTPVLKDEIGPLFMQYDLDNHRLFFDSVETMQLGKVIQDYMCLTKETTLLDIASDFGALSLIMAHKCEKVIKLIAEPRAKCLVNESEKLKKANRIHNVLFTEFKTENIITICEPLIERCITVAIVKLKPSPRLGGPLEDLMKALRNLPSIWQVILCGSFTDEIHESIAVLTSEDDSMGERYFPMQGCILDKSPTVVSAFDLVILFERKSLIAPKVKLFAPGPTVNVAVDSETSDSDSMDAQEMKFQLPSDRDHRLENSKGKCEEGLPLSTNDRLVSSLPEIKELRFDQPPPPLGTFLPFSHPPPSSNGEFQFNNSPPSFQRIPIHPNHSYQVREDFQNDNPPSFFDSRFPNSRLDLEPYSPVREDLQSNCPLPLLEIYSSGPIYQGPHALVRHNFQNHYYPPLPPENHYNSPHHPEPYPVVSNEFQHQYQPPPPPSLLHLPLPPVLLKNKEPSQLKKKKPQFFYPPPPPTRFPSPPPPPPLPPPDETDLLEKKLTASPTSTTAIDAQVGVCEEGKISEIVNSADVISSVAIKSEPIDSSYSTVISEANRTLLETNCDSQTTPEKDVLVQMCEGKVSDIVSATGDLISRVRIKSEPIDPSYSVDLLEINDTSLEASCYSSTTTVKTRPLQDEIKNESNVADCGTTVKAEPLQDGEEKESNLGNSGTSYNVTIKSDFTNQSLSVNFSDAHCQNIALPVIVESKSGAFSPIRNSSCEPMDMQISPSLPDFQSMETPIHNPRALGNITPMTVSKTVSVADSEFPVQTNQSFLVKVKPINVDREPGEIRDSNGENEDKNKQKNKLPQKHISTDLVVSRKLNHPPLPFSGKYSEFPHKRRKHRRSSSPKRMRRPPTPDRRRRSLLSDRRREKRRKSPLREARRSGRSRSRSPRRR